MPGLANVQGRAKLEKKVRRAKVVDRGGPKVFTGQERQECGGLSGGGPQVKQETH